MDGRHHSARRHHRRWPSDGSLTSAKDAAFNLSSSEAASFECQLDGAAAQPCDAAASWTALADGSHDLAVRATDLAGNTGPVQHRTWTIDATAPNTTVTATPGADSSETNKSMTITTSSTEPGTTACALDSATWSACTGPLTVSGLADGQHSIAVRATDLAGNTDATRRHHVDTTTPPPAVECAPPSPRRRTSAPASSGRCPPRSRHQPTAPEQGVLTITHDLKDRVVNGIVKVAASNLTVENCDIRGDSSNKPTSGAPMMVNTDGGIGTHACATTHPLHVRQPVP